MGDLLIGTSGFSFDDWVGEIYPKTIKKQEMLPYYENVLSFSTLEVNYTLLCAAFEENHGVFCEKDFGYIFLCRQSL